MEDQFVIPGEEEESKLPFNPIKFPNVNDLQMRLCQSIIRYDGEPVWISDHPKSNKIVEAYYLKDGQQATPFLIDVDHPSVDISSPPLGYINFEKAPPAYVSRLSERRQKQGVDIRRLKIRGGGTSVAFDRIFGGANNWINLREMIVGSYPSFETSLSSNYGKAFHRKFAIEVNVSEKVRLLSFMGNPIGIFRRGSDRIVFKPSFSSEPFVKLMKEAGVPL